MVFKHLYKNKFVSHSLMQQAGAENRIADFLTRSRRWRRDVQLIFPGLSSYPFLETSNSGSPGENTFYKKFFKFIKNDFFGSVKG